MKRTPLLLIILILISVFLRSYQIVERFDFAADGDLYSWIVKDIAIDHHLRLIGQLTSAEGIFIGPLFYYLLIPFFLITKMDPIGVSLLGVLVGVLSLLSYYFVLSRLFNKTVGLVAALLHTVLLATINFDRWIVPTIFTKLWAIWYLYIILMIARGNFSVLPLLGIMIGLIWHVHIALVPTLIAIPAAFIISKKLPGKKEIALFFILLILTSIPLVLFESRHQFSQTLSLIENFSVQRAGPSGLEKLSKVLGMIIQNTNSLFFAPFSFKFTQNIFFVILILLSPLFLIKKKIFSKKELLPIFLWFFGVVVFFSLTSSPISEYYFSNLEVIFISFVSLVITFIIRTNKIFSVLLVVFLMAVFLENTYFFITSNIYHKGYAERKATVEFIKKDASDKGYPCVGITYITALGENVGFRYFFYLNNVHLVRPSVEVPVYNIVLPDELSPETEEKFGHIGLIKPTSIPSKETVEKSCQAPNSNLADPMLGFVK